MDDFDVSTIRESLDDIKSTLEEMKHDIRNNAKLYRSTLEEISSALSEVAEALKHAFHPSDPRDEGAERTIFDLFDNLGRHLRAVDETLTTGFRRMVIRRRPPRQGEPVTTVAHLQPGDLVVHAERGVGRYVETKMMRVDGRETELLLIEYAEGARFYLPLDRLDLITKYVGQKPAALDVL